MERKQLTDYTNKIIFTKLFRDDIENIMERITFKGLILEISDSENKYDSLEDLEHYKGKNPDEIILTGKGNEFSYARCFIIISNKSTYISISGDENLIPLGYELISLH